jgi:hypothetical protein
VQVPCFVAVPRKPAWLGFLSCVTYCIEARAWKVYFPAPATTDTATGKTIQPAPPLRTSPHFPSMQILLSANPSTHAHVCQAAAQKIAL